MARKLLLVLAHPDDESMGNGTLIVRFADAGWDVHLVCATRGGMGWNGRPAGARFEELPEIRSRELAQAAEVLGLASVELWDYPDGGVPQQDQDEIAARIRGAVDRLGPDVVVGWGPDGGYGHPDHIAVGACTDAALADSGLPHFQMAIDGPQAEAWSRAIEGAGGSGFTLQPVMSVDARFEPSPAELERVKAAVRCHDSQLSPMYQALLESDERAWWMARNCYVLAPGSPAAELSP